MEGKVTISLKEYKDLERTLNISESKHNDLIKSIEGGSDVIHFTKFRFDETRQYCYTRDNYIKDLIDEYNKYVHRTESNESEIGELNSIIKDRNKQIDELKNRSLIKRILNK